MSDGYASMKDYEEANDVDQVLDEVSESTKGVKPTPNLPEAPLSINIIGYYKGFHVGFTIRRSDGGSVPVQKTRELVDEMILQGFKPSWNEQTNKTAVVEAQVAPEAPICGVHGTPMTWKTGVSKASGKSYAFHACSVKNADGSFCNYRPPKI